jgi:hypothetical protein
MARQTTTLERPVCDGCRCNLLTCNAWLTTAEGEELCLNCVDARALAEQIKRVLEPSTPEWIAQELDKIRAAKRAERQLATHSQRRA